MPDSSREDTPIRPVSSLQQRLTGPIANKPIPPVPVNYGMLLFPAFQALDVFGPLDALNILSWNHPMNLALVRPPPTPQPGRPPIR